MFKKIIPLMALLAFQAHSAIITAHIAADNAFALYTGNADGSALTYIGRNSAQWTTTDAFTFNHTDGEFLYIAAWSDNAVAQGVIGQFDIAGGPTILTGTNWQSHLTFLDINATFGYLPPIGQVASEIGENTWSNVTNTVDNGAGPWGMRPGISAASDWMWGSNLLQGSGYGEYQVFRVQAGEPVAAVPEPGTLALMGLGLAGLAGLRRFRRKN